MRALAFALVAASAVAYAQGRAGSETEEEQTFQAAERAFAEQRFDEAEEAYAKVTAINPARPVPWEKRGRILIKQKKPNEAVKLLRQAQQTIPNNNGINGVLGLALYQTGAKQVAVSIMEEVVASQPNNNPDLQFVLGQYYLSIHDKRAAAAIETYLRTRDPSAAALDGPMRYKLGRAYLDNKQWNEAEQLFEGMLKVNPGDRVASASLGEVFAGKGECSKAITLFEKLLADAPKQPSIWYHLGGCYGKVNRWADAKRVAEQYAQAAPRDARAHLLVGEARHELRDYPGAIAAFEQAKKLEPQNPLVARGLGRTFVAQKSFSSAIGVLESADRAKPDDPEIMIELAEAYVQTRQPPAKLTAIADRLAKAGDAESLAEAGVAAYAANDDARAVKLFEQAREKSPAQRRARNGEQMALARQAQADLGKGDLASAEAALTKAQALDPESVQGNRNLGLVLVLEKKWPDAERVLKLALKKVPRDLVVNRLLGRVYVATKRRDDALHAYETAAQTALRTRGPALAELYAELGPVYIDAGRLDQAVTVLDTAVKEAGQTPALAAAQRNLAIAFFRRGLERLKDAKLAEAALDDLGRAAATPKPTFSAKESSAAVCASALAALAAGKAQLAQDGFARAAHEGGCQFRAPYDKIGLDFFSAYAQYRDTQSPQKRDAAAKAFQKFLPKATGALQAQLRDLIRSSFELEAYDYWVRGEEGKAAAAIRNAGKVASKGERRELDHNLAVVEMAEGKSAAAQKAFEELGQRPAEALVNLGILYDRAGDSKRALELYRRANERGARAPKLREWIDVKERLLASGGGK